MDLVNLTQVGVSEAMSATHCKGCLRDPGRRDQPRHYSPCRWLPSAPHEAGCLTAKVKLTKNHPFLNRLSGQLQCAKEGEGGRDRHALRRPEPQSSHHLLNKI